MSVMRRPFRAYYSVLECPDREMEIKLATALSTRRVGRPTLDQANALMDAILEQTLKALQLRGSEGLSIDQLAQDIGVTKRTIYRHFDSKAGLIAAVVSRELRRLEHAAVSEVAPDVTPIDALYRWARSLFFFQTEAATVSFTNYIRFEAARDADLAGRMRDWHGLIVRRLLPLITAAQADGSVVSMAPNRVMLLLFDLMGGPASRMTLHLDGHEAFGDETPEQYFTSRWAAFVRLVAPDPWGTFINEPAPDVR